MIHNADKRWFSLVYVDEYVREFDTLYLDDDCNLEVTRIRQLEAPAIRERIVNARAGELNNFTSGFGGNRVEDLIRTSLQIEKVRELV
jgi:hypothetical protein